MTRKNLITNRTNKTTTAHSPIPQGHKVCVFNDKKTYSATFDYRFNDDIVSNSYKKFRISKLFSGLAPMTPLYSRRIYDTYDYLEDNMQPSIVLEFTGTNVGFDFTKYEVSFNDTESMDTTTYSLEDLVSSLLPELPTANYEFYTYYNITSKKLKGVVFLYWGVNIEINFEKAVILISYYKNQDENCGDHIECTGVDEYVEKCYPIHEILSFYRKSESEQKEGRA